MSPGAKTVVTVIGARPQFVKATVVSRAIRLRGLLAEKIVHTGQHYDENMSRVFFDELGIPRPDFNLGIGSGSHGAQTGRMLEEIERVLLDVRPDWMLVYGDTNSTLAGALAATKLHIPVAHVEAGLRSFNRAMPEEINRVLTDHVSDLLFAPTPVAIANLEHEGVEPSRMHVVGDVMYDAALYYGARAETESTVLARLNLTPGAYVLATVHRAENTDDPARLAAIVAGLADVARETPVVLPLHPRTRAVLECNLTLRADMEALCVIEPVGYLDMVMLERGARLIATDSGGVQKEAYFYGKPCVTLRDETEWRELVDTGWNVLCPPHSQSVVADAVRSRMDTRGANGALYGKGNAAERIASLLI
jgi:UDP-GlcNAc3NAcA epimerase